MNFSPRFATLAALLATAACSGGGNNNQTDASTDAAKEASVKDSGKTDTGTPVDDGGTPSGPTIDPACTAPDVPPSAGSCIPGDAGLPCNPVTNEGCNADAGESCDFNQNTGFGCYPPPPPNTQALCATCDDQNTACLPGSTCMPATDAGGAMECAKFCCTDADCGNGHCDKTTYQTDPLGVCVK